MNVTYFNNPICFLSELRLTDLELDPTQALDIDINNADSYGWTAGVWTCYSVTGQRTSNSIKTAVTQEGFWI